MENLVCEVCNVEFSKQWVLRRHQREQHSGKTFHCEYCDNFVCKRQENLKTHIMNMHPEMQEEPVFTSPHLPPLLKTPVSLKPSSTNEIIQKITKNPSIQISTSKVTKPDKTRIVVGRISQPLNSPPSSAPRIIRLAPKSATPNNKSQQQSPMKYPTLGNYNRMPSNPVTKLEIEIIGNSISNSNKMKRPASPNYHQDSSPKKKFIQLEVLTKDNEDELDDSFDGNEEHSSISILDVKEIPCPINKDFYKPSNSVMNRSRTEIEFHHSINNLIVKRRDPPKPILSFDEIGFSKRILEQIEMQGIETPMPIQSSIWPIAMSGYDVVCVVESKSGRKLAYLLPAIVHLSHQEKVQQGEGPIILILASNNEAVESIKSTVERFIDIQIFHSKDNESLKDSIEKNYEVPKNFIISTADEVSELLRDKVINLNRTSYIVIDGIDKIDLNILQDVLGQIRRDAQLLTFCEELSDELQSFVDKNLKDYVFIQNK